MPQPLRDSLAEYPRIMLEAIAQGWGLVLTDEQTPEIVERLAAEMVNSESVQFLLRRLNEVEREALAYMAAVGQVKVHVMTRKYGSIRRLGPGRLEWEAAWRQPVSAAERLWFVGLIYREYGKDERYHGEVFYIPEELRAALPRMSVELPTFRVAPASSPPVMHDDGDALARDVFVVLSYVRTQKVRARKGVLTARELAALRPRWAGSSEPQRLHFLLHLCEKAHLIAVKEGQWTPTAEAAAWLKGSDITRRRVLYQAWLEDADWNELWLMPGVHCEDTGWRNHPLLPRPVVVDYLRQCPAATWWTIQSFVDSLYQVAPDLMRPDGDYDSWYIRDAQTGQYLMGWGSWDKVEGALIRYLLRYSLRWLGVVAVGQPEGEASASCFLLTQQGAAVLVLPRWVFAPRGERRPASAGLGTGDIVESQPQRMTVQADLQVSVPRDASWYDRFLLERLARWVGEKDGIARYRMDATTVRACLAGGVTMEQILAFLRRVTGNRVPQAAVRALHGFAADPKPMAETQREP